MKTRIEAEPESLKKIPAFFVEDATREAIIMHLLGWPIAALSTDEGAQLKGLFRGSPGAMAKMADSSPIYHARVSTGRAALDDYRFLIHAMMQPDVFEDCKVVLGVGKGSVGLINRCTIAIATSSPNLEALEDFGLDPAVEKRYAALVELLINRAIDLVLKRGKYDKRSLLRLSAAAERRFKDISREAASIQHLPEFAHAIEYTSRHCERVLHAAGTLHAVEHDAEGEIQVESVEAAHQVGLWSLDNYSDLMAPRPKPTVVEADAARLERELINAARFHGPYLPLPLFRSMSPNIGLTPARFSRALPLLADAGKVTLCVLDGKQMIFVYTPPPADWLNFNRPAGLI